MTAVLSIAVLVGSGIVAGVLLAVALSVVPAFASVPAPEYVRIHQLVGRNFDKVMPPLVGLCALSSAVLAVTGAEHRALRIAAVVFLVGVSLVSQFGNVPINKKVRRLIPDALPGDWHDPRSSWRNWHLLRTYLAVLAAVASACSVVLS